MLITGRQIRVIRAGLGWSQEDLAAKTGLSVRTIQRAEVSPDVPSTSSRTLTRICDALRTEMLARRVRRAS